PVELAALGLRNASSAPPSDEIEDRLRRVVAPDPADPAASPGPAATDQQVRHGGLDTPRPHLVLGLGPRPGEVAVENVAARHPDRALDVEGTPHLQARSAVGVAGEAVLDGLLEVGVEGGEA